MSAPTISLPVFRPDRGQPLRLTPTDISQFVRLEQCERFLRFRLAERAGQKFMEDYGVTPQRITPLLSLSGHDLPVVVGAVVGLGGSGGVVDGAEVLAEGLLAPPSNSWPDSDSRGVIRCGATSYSSMNFCPARSARRKRRKRSHCSKRTNIDTSVGVSRSGRSLGRTGKVTGAFGIGAAR